VRAGALGGELVVPVDQAALGEGEAAAADAAGEPVAELLQLLDPLVEFLLPAVRGSLPERHGRRRVLGQEAEHLGDQRERDADRLGGADERDPAQRRAVIAALVAGGAAAVDEALALVEAQGGRGDAAAFGQFADGQLGGYGRHPASLA
jgi:hypothetical protein